MRKQYLTYDGPDASERVSDIFRFLNQGEMSATESCCFSEGDISFYTISCEKYYFRVGSNLTITLSLFVKGNHIDACLFVGGGGSGLLGSACTGGRPCEKGTYRPERFKRMVERPGDSGQQVGTEGGAAADGYSAAAAPAGKMSGAQPVRSVLDLPGRK